MKLDIGIYKGQVVQFIGGPQEYLGELEEHPTPGWVRIKNPCMIGPKREGDMVRVMIVKHGGHQKAYRPYVDIWIPGDSIVEIRPLHPKGEMFKIYQKEIGRPDIENIIIPDGAGTISLAKMQ